LEPKPFPVTVIGVTVIEARGTNTGVPAADTCTADHASPRTTDARLGLIVENYWEERINLMQCNAIVISKTRVKSEAFQSQPRGERKVERECSDAAKQRNECLGKND
jgi:hypothetical protein